MSRNENNAMDSSRVREELTKLLAEHVGTSEASRAGLLLLARTAADAVLSKFAVVRLPDMVVDGMGQPMWPVVSRDDYARVAQRASDDRLVMDGVSNPIATPEHALSLAAALIAAHRHVTQENSGG
jgi:hypothetical protein